MRENVEFSLRMRGVEKSARRKRVDTWLERMQISEFAERNINHLSGGQRQRVALARSLVTEPQISCSTSRCRRSTPISRCGCRRCYPTLQRELGITFVYVTHSQSEAFSMADRP